MGDKSDNTFILVVFLDLKKPQIALSIRYNVPMSSQPEIFDLIERLLEELKEIEEDTTQGLNAVRILLNLFPENAMLAQAFGFFSSAIFFAENTKAQIHGTARNLSISSLSPQRIQEIGQELATTLGRTLELKTQTKNLRSRMERLL
jgi:hypothetical protein